MRKRVVLTGLGVTSPIGNTIDEFWENLITGKSGVGLTTKCDCSDLPSKISGEVKGFDPLNYMEKKEYKRLDLSQQYALAASAMAIGDAELKPGTFNPERVGVVIGSGIGGIITFEQQHSLIVQGKPGRISPFFIPMMIVDMAAGIVAIKFGFKGPNYAAVSACASGANAIGDSFQIIQRGSADVMITGGTEASITRTAIAGFCNAKALSLRNEQPEKASRPFDKDRDGFIISEGAGIIVLESLEHALKRGAKIYCELAGLGLSADAYHITAPSPDGDGAARSIKAAIDDANVSPYDVDYINTHGTSTLLNDITETIAIKSVFGERAYKIPCNSTKSMTGHMLGATGAVELIAAALQVKNKKIHQTINLENPDSKCDLYYVHDGPKNYEPSCVLSNSFGFGGHNITLLLKTYSDGNRR
ncbi:MAG: beta-ketoacyl-[acyl-carrier-protein] synthase II [Candidatus Zixiibacteriota bacterium]|nr:MAG: beta-ketoacyl-[acyl-carrier-protein] synthase II [candidate division Zixibacteria bacterium]